MKRDLKRFQENHYDLLVIGGGINGAGIVHVAAKRGLRTALIEKNDFASGTSSKSSKLMHGGLRYLENFQFHLVKEALQERTFHVRNTPHLVHPLRFLIPVYQGDRRPLWMMHLGVWLYDLLAGKQGIGKHARLSRKQMLELEPHLKPEGLLGGVSYYDAQMDDARVCLENVLMADQLGAHVANYVEVTGLIKEHGKVIGITACDKLNEKSESFEIRARKVFCAAGPWANELLKMDNPDAWDRVRPTKGVHIVTSKFQVKNALFIPSRQDKRIFFILPWKNQAMIGTTDTDYFGSPDQVCVEPSDVEYLLQEAQRVFPQMNLTADDFDTCFAGLRPLVAKSGKESAVPREHFIFKTDSDLFFVVGGKYTTYRVIAEECVDHLSLPGKGSIESLFGGGKIEENLADTAREYQIAPALLTALIAQYGTRYYDILQLTRNNPALTEPICEGSDHIKAEIIYARKVEMAQTDEDVLFRRLSIGYVPRELEGAKKALRA